MFSGSCLNNTHPPSGFLMPHLPWCRCGTKVEAIKTISLHDPPNVLMITLKRNAVSRRPQVARQKQRLAACMQNTQALATCKNMADSRADTSLCTSAQFLSSGKLNTLVRFPETLNLAPYTSAEVRTLGGLLEWI